MSECSAPTCQPQARFVCAEHRLAHLEREREADRAAVRDAEKLANSLFTRRHRSDWLKKHALAIQRATEARG